MPSSRVRIVLLENLDIDRIPLLELQGRTRWIKLYLSHATLDDIDSDVKTLEREGFRLEIVSCIKDPVLRKVAERVFKFYKIEYRVDKCFAAPEDIVYILRKDMSVVRVLIE